MMPLLLAGYAVKANPLLTPVNMVWLKTLNASARNWKWTFPSLMTANSFSQRHIKIQSTRAVEIIDAGFEPDAPNLGRLRSKRDSNNWSNCRIRCRGCSPARSPAATLPYRTR